jgi:predicted metal-dependent phosphoesterase TrpH
MPARQPFTALCQLAARPRLAGRADLHLHTTHSDGTYTAQQVVDLARRGGLSAIAVTDHDTLAGVVPARNAALGSGLEVIAGVEITCEYRGRELHLLAYFVSLDDAALNDALTAVRHGRVERFREMVERLRRLGVSVAGVGPDTTPDALGRRHLAEMIVKARRASSVRDAFRRYLLDGGRVNVAKKRLPVAEALALVGAAGGVAACAHPPYDCVERHLAELHALGLGAVEVEYPDTAPSRRRELRGWAIALGLAVSGGSDCHGPGRRCLGACSVSADELERLREMSRRAAGVGPRIAEGVRSCPHGLPRAL